MPRVIQNVSAVGTRHAVVDPPTRVVIVTTRGGRAALLTSEPRTYLGFSYTLMIGTPS